MFDEFLSDGQKAKIGAICDTALARVVIDGIQGFTSWKTYPVVGSTNSRSFVNDGYPTLAILVNDRGNKQRVDLRDSWIQPADFVLPT